MPILTDSHQSTLYNGSKRDKWSANHHPSTGAKEVPSPQVPMCWGPTKTAGQSRETLGKPPMFSLDQSHQRNETYGNNLPRPQAHTKLVGVWGGSGRQDSIFEMPLHIKAQCLPDHPLQRNYAQVWRNLRGGQLPSLLRCPAVRKPVTR